jgi:hypothetical protein
MIPYIVIFKNDSSNEMPKYFKFGFDELKLNYQYMSSEGLTVKLLITTDKAYPTKEIILDFKQENYEKIILFKFLYKCVLQVYKTKNCPFDFSAFKYINSKIGLGENNIEKQMGKKIFSFYLLLKVFEAYFVNPSQTMKYLHEIKVNINSVQELQFYNYLQEINVNIERIINEEKKGLSVEHSVTYNNSRYDESLMPGNAEGLNSNSLGDKGDNGLLRETVGQVEQFLDKVIADDENYTGKEKINI